MKHLSIFKHILYCIAILGFGLRVFSTNVRAMVLLSDDFSDGNLLGWNVVRNEQWIHPELPCYWFGVPTNWQVLLQRVGIQIQGGACQTEMIPANITFTDQETYTWEFDMTFPETMSADRNYLLRWKDARNWYGMKIIGDSFFMQKIVNGYGYAVPNSGLHYPFVANETYHFKNEFLPNKQFRISINGEKVLEYTDVAPFVTEGTPGFQASTGNIQRAISWFDNALITTLDPEPTPTVPYFSQRDSLWKDETYDRADDWSTGGKTIENWGCALTSIVMILRNYGIDTLPGTQTEINPSSLNTWLLAQKDGYVNGGHVNFLAIPRLTKEYNNTHENAPILEHSSAEYSQQVATTMIQNNTPVILKMPGHFVVGHSVVPHGEDIRIHDPYDESKKRLSQFEQNPLSMRIFSPSHTDLSYVRIAHDPTISFSITGDGVVSTSWTESGVIGGDKHSQPEIQYTEIAKPSDGSYNIQFWTQMPKEFSATVLAYTIDGEVTVLPINAIATRTPQSLVLSYTKNEPSVLESPQTSVSLRELLKQMYYYSYIRSLAVYDVLDQFVAHIAANETEENLERYKTTLLSLVRTYAESFDPIGMLYLEEKINQLVSTTNPNE